MKTNPIRKGRRNRFMHPWSISTGIGGRHWIYRCPKCGEESYYGHGSRKKAKDDYWSHVKRDHAG